MPFPKQSGFTTEKGLLIRGNLFVRNVHTIHELDGRKRYSYGLDDAVSVPWFCGRETELKALEDFFLNNGDEKLRSLGKTKCVLVTGTGKTQFVYKFVQKNCSQYANVVYFTCPNKFKLRLDLTVLNSRISSDRERLPQTYDNIAPFQQLKSLKTLSDSVFQEILLQKTLIIFDGVRKITDILDMLPMSLTAGMVHPDIILTSDFFLNTFPSEGMLTKSIHLDELEDDRNEFARNFFTSICLDVNFSELDEIIRRCQGVPSQINLALNYFAFKKKHSQDYDASTYVAEFLEEECELDLNVDDDNQAVPHAFRIFFKLALKELKQHYKEALVMLQQLAFTIPTAVTPEFCLALMEPRGESLIRADLETLKALGLMHPEGSLSSLVVKLMRKELQSTEGSELRALHQYLNSMRRLLTCSSPSPGLQLTIVAQGYHAFYDLYHFWKDSQVFEFSRFFLTVVMKIDAIEGNAMLKKIHDFQSRGIPGQETAQQLREKAEAERALGNMPEAARLFIEAKKVELGGRQPSDMADFMMEVLQFGTTGYQDPRNPGTDPNLLQMGFALARNLSRKN